MAVYTPLANEEIAELVHEVYGLGQLQYALGIAQGVENTNYLLGVLDHGGVERKYILTLYEKRVALGDIPFFLNLMRHLAGRGVACPQPVLRRDGSLSGEIASKQAAIVTFLEGKSNTHIEPVHAAAVGEAMARLHLAAEGFSATRSNSLSLGGWQKLFDKIRSRLDEIQPGLAEWVEVELNYLSLNMPSMLSLPRGIIHADCFPDNVFFIGDRVSGIIDFYFACEDFLVYDLAIAINAWCFESTHDFNRTKSRQMISSYQRVRKLKGSEIKALPVLLRGAAMRFLLTRAHDLLFHEKSALVMPKDPLEYLKKLQFHQQLKHPDEYGA